MSVRRSQIAIFAWAREHPISPTARSAEATRATELIPTISSGKEVTLAMRIIPIQPLLMPVVSASWSPYTDNFRPAKKINTAHPKNPITNMKTSYPLKVTYPRSFTNDQQQVHFFLTGFPPIFALANCEKGTETFPSAFLVYEQFGSHRGCPEPRGGADR